MAFLISSILLMVILNFIFKIFSINNVRNFHAIIINYFTCFIVGLFFFEFTDLFQTPQKKWFPNAIALSVAFILGFNILASTIRYFGISLGTLMQRMSLVITAAAGVFIFQESVTLGKIVGVLLGLGSIFLIFEFDAPGSFAKMTRKQKWLWILPILTLLSSSIVDLGLQFTEKFYLNDQDWHSFNSVLFLGAGTLGLCYLLISSFINKTRPHFTPKEIIGGIVLGIPNYFSIYFLVRALNTGFEGSFLFPVMNISIIILSVAGSLILFKERIHRKQGWGMILACIALLMLTISN